MWRQAQPENDPHHRAAKDGSRASLVIIRMNHWMEGARWL